MPPNSRQYSRSGKAPPGEGSSRLPGSNSQSAQSQVPGTSFAARFGQLILSDGIAAIPSALYHYQRKLELTAQQVWFISYILAHKWSSELPYPSMNKMARCAGVTRRVLQYRCNELHNCGYLQIYPRRGEKNDQETNAYDFAELFRRMEELLLEEERADNPVRADGKSPGEEDYAEYDSSFIARYGRVICKHGVAAIPRALFAHQRALGLSPQQVWFVCYIFSFQWDTALPYPSLRKMAERTGYSRQQLINIKSSLVEAGYLRLVHRYSENGQDTNAYDFSGLLEAIRKQLQPDKSTEADISQTGDADESEGEDEGTVEGEEPMRQRHVGGRPRQTRSSRFSNVQTAEGMTTFSASREVTASTGTHVGIEQGLTGGLERPFTEGVEQGFTRGLEQDFTGGVEQPLTGRVSRASTSPTNRALPRGRKGTLPEIESTKEETKQEDDSNHHSQKRKKVTRETRTSIPGYSPYIAGVASDFSEELGDSVHKASNMKQALNLWTASELGEQQFVEMMQEARKLTRKYQSRPTWDTMSNKMAYYFITLRDLLGLEKEG